MTVLLLLHSRASLVCFDDGGDCLHEPSTLLRGERVSRTTSTHGTTTPSDAEQRESHPFSLFSNPKWLAVCVPRPPSHRFASLPVSGFGPSWLLWGLVLALSGSHALHDAWWARRLEPATNNGSSRAARFPQRSARRPGRAVLVSAARATRRPFGTMRQKASCLLLGTRSILTGTAPCCDRQHSDDAEEQARRGLTRLADGAVRARARRQSKLVRLGAQPPSLPATVIIKDLTKRIGAPFPSPCDPAVRASGPWGHRVGL